MEVQGAQAGDAGAAANPNPAAGGAGAAPAAAAASQSPQVKVSDSGGTGASAPASGPDWAKDFDADTKDFVTQRGFKDPKAVLESYRNLEKLRGVSQDRLLKLPDPNAGADAPEWKDVYEKLGKPANPDGYNLKPKDPNNTGFTNWAKETFHKLNLSTAQGQELVNQFNAHNEKMEGEANAAHTAKVQEQVGTLKKEWGAAYQQNVNRAQAAYRQFGIPDAAIDSLEKSIGFDGVMKMFHKLGTQVGEQSFVSGDAQSGFGDGVVLTPEQANARIKALKQDGAWSDRYLKGGVKEKQEMERLHEMANPTD